MKTLPQCPKYTRLSCQQHGAHDWQWEPLPEHWDEQTKDIVRQVALEQMATMCPAAGNILAFEQFVPELSSPMNWVLRRYVGDLDEGEVAIARAV